VEEQTVGKDTTILMQWNSGAADVHPVLSKTCSFDMTDCYTARVLPMIDTVSASSGYTSGGQILTVTGQGFEYGALDIKVAGETCKELTKADTHFTC